MNRFFTIILSLLAFTAIGQPLKDRVVHNDPASYRSLNAVHAGAGKMGFTQMIGRTELSTNFLYLHSGVIEPKSGIGHHFHHTIEEMYVILDGEAQFTINGRTSVVKAPAVIPCKLGDAHAIYNHTSKPLKWLNYAVSEVKGRSDNFDLGDTRASATLDAIPTFVTGKLEKKPAPRGPYGPKPRSNFSSQILGPDIFSTDWNHVDFLVIPKDSAVQSRKLEGFEEVYYVVKGSGEISLGSEKVNFKADDAFYGKLGENLAITNSGSTDLEILVIGVATSKKNVLAIEKPLVNPKSMVLQMDFVVPAENREAFEKMYYSIYVPAMTVQPGYLESKLLRLFPENIAKSIEAEPTEFNYQVQISFDTEENRRKWVASAEHQIAWPAASKLAKSFKWRGYEVMGDDFNY